MKTIIEASIDGMNLRAFHYAAAPDESRISKNSILFCLPGGGSSAEYFDLDPTHSFAKKMNSKGWDVITIDHPGTATNPLPKSHPFLKPRKSVDYIAQALEIWLQKERFQNKNIIGVGHSMGGMMLTLLHAYTKHFKAIGLFGSSAGGLDWGLTEDERVYIEKPIELEKNIESLTLAKFKSQFPPSTGGPSGKSIVFGGETPALTKRLRDVSCELYAAGGMMSMVRGSFRTEVEAIDIPIFFAFGDHDIGIPPESAPKDYIRSPKTEILILENTGHNHFAFSSIEVLCQRFDYWASKLA